MTAQQIESPIRRTAGFTLLEALVSLLLMGIVLTALAAITGQWLPNWNRGFVRVQRSELTAVALDRVVADLASAAFVPPNAKTRRPLFEGREHSVILVRSALGPNTRPGLDIVRIEQTGDRDTSALVRSRTMFAPRMQRMDQIHFGDVVVLLKAPYRASFSYAAADGKWHSDWLHARELPTAVRLVIRETASGRALAASTATLIHTQLPAFCIKPRAGRLCGTPTGSDAYDQPDSEEDDDRTAPIR
jgi:general secretion pathway protein J